MAAVLVIASGRIGGAQKTTPVHPGKGGSPHVRTDWTIDGANLSIEYGRPSLKGRPDGRAHAGRPALAHGRRRSDRAQDRQAAEVRHAHASSRAPIPSTPQPGEKDWQLIVGKLGKPGQWGVPYNATLEIGRAPMSSPRRRPGRAAEDLDRRHAEGRHAEGRVGHQGRDDSVYGGIGSRARGSRFAGSVPEQAVWPRSANREPANRGPAVTSALIHHERPQRIPRPHQHVLQTVELVGDRAVRDRRVQARLP